MQTYILKHAWRSLSRMRTYTLINIVGLIISLTGTIIIARYVHQELTVDDYVPHVERTYWIGNQEELGWREYGDMEDGRIEDKTRIVPFRTEVDMSVKGIHYHPKTIAIDTLFYDFFPRKVVMGTTVLKAPEDAVVTRAFAEKVWGKECPLGKVLHYSLKTVKVVGVVEAAENKTVMDYDVALSQRFGQFVYMSYVIGRLKPGVDASAVNQYYLDHEQQDSWYQHPRLLPLKDAYFNHDIGQGNRQSVNALIVAGVLLLVVGLFNFMNIYTIIIRMRRKNFCVKKMFGASVGKVVQQVMTENLLICLVALGLSWLLILFFSSYLTQFYHITLVPAPLFDVCLSLGIAIVFPLLLTLPAIFVIRRAKHVDSLVDAQMGKASLVRRHIPLVLQYAFTFFLLVVSLFSIHQVHYMLNADMGYDTNDVISFDMLPGESMEIDDAQDDAGDRFDHYIERFQRHKDMAEQIRKSPLFQNCYYVEKRQPASLTEDKQDAPGLDIRIKIAGSNQDFIPVEFIYMDKELFDTYGMQMKEGVYPEAPDTQYAITEYTLKCLGLKSCKGLTVEFNDGGFNGNLIMPISGVVKDFRHHHMASAPLPLILVPNPGLSGDFRLLARVTPGKHAEALAYLQKKFKAVNGDNGELEYEWVADDIARVYEDDVRTSHIFVTFALLAIFVSCLGLFGISLYDIQHRRREIAIRKVHGAKMKDIFPLLSKRYIYALCIGFLIGAPLAFYALQLYMQEYADHVSLTPWHFLLSALLMCLLTFATIFWQIRKASKENPADVIKSE